MSMRRFTAFAVAVAVGLAAAGSPLASPEPDGLERVAQDEGFAHRAEPGQKAPVSDYSAPGVDDERLATGLAGFAGTLGAFGLAAGVGAVLRRRRLHDA